MPKGWQPLVPWIEQLMEESLGKGGKGVVVFDDQFLNPVGPRFIVGPAYRSSSTLQLRVVTDLIQLEEEKSFHLYQPYLARKESLDRLLTLATSFVSALDAQLRTIGNELLGVPVKLRRAPAAYHSTEQSEMDGPPFLVSLRVLACDHEASIPGSYTDTFLCAQAVSTWQAMMEQGRPCFLLIIDGSIDDAIEPCHRFFSEVAAHLRGQ